MLEILVADYILSTQDATFMMEWRRGSGGLQELHSRWFQEEVRTFLKDHVAPHIFITRSMRAADPEGVISAILLDVIRRMEV